MSITETFHFDKGGNVEKNPLFKRFFLTLVIVLVAILSFGVGRLTSKRGGGVEINYSPSALENTPNTPQAGVSVSGSVVASSQGTRYYYSHCKNSISEKNKVTFATALMAEEAGYTLALNCKAR